MNLKSILLTIVFINIIVFESFADPINNWDFTTDLLGWGHSKGLSYLSLQGGEYLETQITSNSDYIYRYNLSINITGGAGITIRMKNNSDSNRAGFVYYAGGNWRTVFFNITSNDNDFKIYHIDFNNNPDWSGVLSFFRFLPSTGTSVTNGNVLIDFIKLDELSQPHTLSLPTLTKNELIDQKSIYLRWNDVEGETGYRVLRKTNTNIEYEIIDTLNADQVAFIDRTIKYNRQYTYSIQAFNNTSVSYFSKLAINYSSSEFPDDKLGWNFNSNQLLGWNHKLGASYVSMQEGKYLEAQITSNSDYIYRYSLSINITGGSGITVRMKNNSNSNKALFFFAIPGKEWISYSFNISANDADFKTYFLDFSEFSNWEGFLTHLQFYPSRGTSVTSGNCLIDYIIIHGPNKKYYSIASGNWNDTNVWSLSEGGTPAGSFPGGSDKVVINDHSILVNSTQQSSDIQILGVDQSELIISGGQLEVTGQIQINNSNETNSNGALKVINGGALNILE